MKQMINDLKVVALAGGVGGAKLVDGLANLLPPENLTIVVNTGDDFQHLGLTICPDLDTVCYTLAGIANPATGWGRAGETWLAFENLARLGGPTWFRLGDQDLATHLVRSAALASGASLTQVTREFCLAWDVKPVVLPMSDSPVLTIVDTDEGILPFQEYFVMHQCHPHVRSFEFKGAADALPAPGVIEAIQDSDLVILCPSNPWVSIDPILALPGIRSALAGRFVMAVSPIIAGQTVKGPAAKMFAELGIPPTASAVAVHYKDFLSAFVMDQVDSAEAPDLEDAGIRCLCTDTWMTTQADRVRLADAILDDYRQLLQEKHT